MSSAITITQRDTLFGKRDVCCYDSGYCYYCRSGWYNWGRWVALGCIILFGFIAFLIMARFASMRRRRNGLTPYQGTAWMLPKYSAGGAPPAYIENNPPRPQPEQTSGQSYYGANNSYSQGTHNQGSNTGYYGNQGNQTYQAPQYPPQTHSEAQPYYPPTSPPPAQPYQTQNFK